MGFWRGVGSFFGLSATFSETPPRPVDQLLYDMNHQGTASRVGRIEALSVPAVQQGRNLICGSIAVLPLIQRGPDRQIVRSPLLEQFDPDVPNSVTLAMTLEDLLFEGISWWEVTATDFNGYPVAARHLNVESVTIQPPGGRTPAPLPSGVDPRQGVLYVEGKPTPWSRVRAFHSLNPGLLKVAGRAIRTAILLDRTAAMYAQNPRPLDFFTPRDGAAEPTDDEVRAMLRNWGEARRTGSTAYIGAALDYNTVDTPTPADLQLVELQRRVGLDIANAIGLDAEDLGISTTSRTYQNDVSRRQERINNLLVPFMRAIEDRLSMGDVTRRGHRVAFDLDDYLRADPKTQAEVDEIRLRIGTTTVEEIRVRDNRPTLPPAATPALEPQRAIEAARLDESDNGVNFADDEPRNFFDVDVKGFTADIESRVISGVALPYGRVAVRGGRRYRFDHGSLQWSDLKRVKLLRDHNYSLPLGRAVELEDTPEGFRVKFKVARGIDGDRALDLAEDGVLDGLSVGVEFRPEDTRPDPLHLGVTLVRRATLREVSLTAMPAFDDARVATVAASLTAEGTEVTENPTTEPQAPEPAGTPDLGAAFAAFMANYQNPAPEAKPDNTNDVPQTVNPTRLASFINEGPAYRFDRGGNFVPEQPHVFSVDLHEMALANDVYGDKTDAGKRVMGLLQFTVETGDINETNPTIQRPDMYVDQQDYKTPLWDFVNRGAPPNGVQPFHFPKFNSASGLVGDHTEGVEPTSGSFTSTGQTVTPTALSGKASITREVWDMGGNPAVSTLIFNQMRRGYREGLESATATFLNTLTAATDITLAAGSADETLAAAWDAALADLQFIRGYDFSAFAIEKELYKKFVAARDTAGRVLYPILAPQNANGTAASRFRTLDLGGVTGVPSWALASTAGSPNNSWLFDPAFVHGWATAPQRLEFPGTDASGGYAPVAMVDIAIWGYKAFANSDIGGVRQVIYDTVA